MQSAASRVARLPTTMSSAPAILAPSPSPIALAMMQPSVNPGMAVGGSGDVLAGIAAALIARGAGCAESAAAAAYIHGTAGDIAADAYGQESMSAENILEMLPAAFMQILHVDK